ncbi:MAG TPA: hypothetical protein VGQ83_05560, partial [Polyangia bacterium]
MGLRCAPVVLAAALAGCGPALPPRVYAMDRVYPDACPSVAIAEDEYALITVNANHHDEDHLLVGTCDDATLPDCTWTYCGRLPESQRAPRDVCLPGRVYRKVYDRRRGPGGPPAGEQFVVQPFCVKGRCELGFALWVVKSDESIARRASCRLNVGELRYE